MHYGLQKPDSTRKTREWRSFPTTWPTPIRRDSRQAGPRSRTSALYRERHPAGRRAEYAEDTQYSTGLTLGTGVRIVATEKDYTQGSVLQTGGTLDMSVNGKGFLQITMPDGTIAYTRDGSFSLDNQGNVVTASGYPLQPAINIPAGTQTVTIGNDGVVTVTSASNAEGNAGRPDSAGNRISSTKGLQPTGSNLLVESAASGSPQVGTAGTNGLGTLQQGALETSNVNSVTELVSMIECQRSL